MAIEQRLKEIIHEVKKEISIEDIRMDKNLVDDFGMDSMEMLEFVAELEEAFQIELEDDELDTDVISDITKILQIIERKI